MSNTATELASDYRDVAEEIRKLVPNSNSPGIGEELERLAAGFEKLADSAAEMGERYAKWSPLSADS